MSAITPITRLSFALCRLNSFEYYCIRIVEDYVVGYDENVFFSPSQSHSNLQVFKLKSTTASQFSKSLVCYSNQFPYFKAKTEMKDWIGRLSKMGASDELTEQQARQLHFDLESSYNSFMAALSHAGN